MMNSGHMIPMTVGILLYPVLCAAVKIAAGVLVLKYGKRYAEKVLEEERNG